MRFGVNTLIWSIRFDPALIPFDRLTAAGVAGIETPVFAPEEFDAAGLRRVMDEHGLEATFCSINPPGANPISEERDERERAFAHWKRVISIAGDLGVDLLAGPSYAPVGLLPGRRRTEDEWKRAVEFHQRLAEPLAEAGTDLAVEPINRFETYFLNTAEDAARFAREVDEPSVGILLDTFHSNIEDKNIPLAYAACGRHLKHVHACENDRGIPGSGHVDWCGVACSLKAMGYDGRVTIESFNANAPELSAATAIWRDLAASPDEIAVRGSRFLRELFAAAA